MSRPVSVEELIQLSLEAGKPRFLSKKQRLELRKEPTSLKPKRKVIQNYDEEETSSLPKKKKQQHKYAFDWSLEDDTSQDYQPLVTVDIKNSNEVVKGDKHWSEKPLELMTSRDWRILKDDHNISSKGGNIPNPLRSWDEAAIPKTIIKILKEKLKYNEPTPIQRAAIPLALDNRDVVGVAETGSGKTLAFVLPLLAYILGIEEDYMKHEHTLESNSNRALGLILAPTRELALQITQEAKKFADPLGLSVVTIIGGHQYEETVHSLRNGVHIVVATPGRLVDSLERGIVSLEKCYHLTMDEADKMIDMGFEKSLQQILDYLPTSETLLTSLDGRIFRVASRTTLMFTATISPAIEKITKNYLVTPGYLFIGSANELVDNIDQHFEYMGDVQPNKQEVDVKRFSRLLKILALHPKDKFSVIIFANYKKVVEQIADDLGEKGYRDIAVIHGSKSQDAREVAIQSFRSKKASILVATDVAARGLDVPHVLMVVNFQMSNKFEEYIHRIGRTGRAGQHGESYTFVDDGDKDTFIDMKKFLVKGGNKVPDWLSKASMRAIV